MSLRKREKRFLSQIDRIRELTREEERASRERFSAESEAPAKSEGSAPQGAGGPPARQGAPVPATPLPKRGAGGGSPPRLDTHGERSLTYGKDGTTSGARLRGAGTRRERQRPAVKSLAPAKLELGANQESDLPRVSPSSRKARSRLARPKLLSEAAFREKYAIELDKLHRHTLASRVRDCGQVVMRRPCNACGEPYAETIVTGSCHARACAYCARIAASKRRERLLPALLHVPEYFTARRDALYEWAQERWEKAKRSIEFHSEAIAKAHKRCEETGSEYSLRSLDWHYKQIARAEEERKRYGKQAARLGAKNKEGEREQWGWRLITLSPKWNPRNTEELTVSALAKRWDDVTKRWRKLHKELGPAVCAVVSVEMSAGGFVHLHALAFCPVFLEKNWLQEQIGQGCYVDIRALKTRRYKGLAPLAAFHKALKEAVKYAVKSTSPLSAAWLSGAKRRVVHPELAARWTVATHKRQLGRVYGELLRDAMKATEPEKPALGAEKPERKGHCWSCSAELTTEYVEETLAKAVKELGPFWAKAVRFRPALIVKAPREGGSGKPG